MGRPIRARPIASICRSPPDSVRGALLAAFLKAWKQRINFIEKRLPLGIVAAPPAVSAKDEIVGDAHRPEQFAFFRHQTETGPDTRFDRTMQDVFAEIIHPAPARQKSHDGVEERCFAGPVGTDNGDDGARGHFQVDLLHRLDLAVGNAQVRDLQNRAHAATPR